MAHMLCRGIRCKAVAGKSLLACTKPQDGAIGGRVLQRIEQWIQVATLIPTHGGKYPGYHEQPWDYKNKMYYPIHQILDSTVKRMTPNSKVILVEGNVGVGKNEFAKRLAANFDMKYFPSVTEADCFTLTNGFDKRELDPQLPAHLQHYDLKKFYADPNPQCGRIGELQARMFQQKFITYAEALLHLFSTGQGVVVTRSVFSDHVFVDALEASGYVSRNFLKYYDDIEAHTLIEIPQPHITIYLDAPLKTVRQRIKERNNPIENSPVLSDKYLEAIDLSYKTNVLPQLRESGEVIEIDWTEKADDIEMDVIVEALSELHLENEDKDDPKFLDWNMEQDDFCHYRCSFSKQKGQEASKELQRLFNCIPAPTECPEFLIQGADYETYQDIVEKHPAVLHPVGWSPKLGNNPYLRLF